METANTKPMLIIVDNQGYFQPIFDRMEFQKFPGEIVRTFVEEDTVQTVQLAGSNRRCIIVTDSLVASEHITETDRAAGTASMIRQIREINSNTKILVYSGDFFELDTKFTKEAIDFVDAYHHKGYDLLCKKILEYTI